MKRERPWVFNRTWCKKRGDVQNETAAPGGEARADLVVFLKKDNYFSVSSSERVGGKSDQEE